MALAHGTVCRGEFRCFYCGAPCDGSRLVQKHVKATFTGHAGVMDPGSPAICEGCVLAFAESADVPTFAGSVRSVAKNAMRSFSWLVTADRVVGGTKSDLADWRALCLVPPPPPFAIVLSDRGQKHLLYRGVVCRGGPPYYAVTLEEERIHYWPSELKDALAFSEKLWAAGFPARSSFGLNQFDGDPPPFEAAARLAYPDVVYWDVVKSKPITRLAAWLAPKPEKEANP